MLIASRVHTEIHLKVQHRLAIWTEKQFVLFEPLALILKNDSSIFLCFLIKMLHLCDSRRKICIFSVFKWPEELSLTAGCSFWNEPECHF